MLLSMFLGSISAKMRVLGKSRWKIFGAFLGSFERTRRDRMNAQKKPIFLSALKKSGRAFPVVKKSMEKILRLLEFVRTDTSRNDDCAKKTDFFLGTEKIWEGVNILVIFLKKKFFSSFCRLSTF